MNKPETIVNLVNEKKDIIEKLSLDNINEDKAINKQISNFENTIQYVLGDAYYIQGVLYEPKEDYSYSEIGLASYYGKELHNKKTINNDYNKVTELYARHKTLPLPSIAKITNLDNGLSLIVKINDRHNDNSSLIQVSRKTAQLLKFYKNKITKVKVEILVDPSKQMKVVTQSMNELDFNETINSAPTEIVSISNLEDSDNENQNKSMNLEEPIQIGFEQISDKNLFLKIYGFASYDVAKSIISELNISFNFTTQKESDKYSIILGPLENIEANNLVLSFISKGYKKTEIILE